MTPNVTLHHFTAPQWFMEIGGWERAENIPLFVEYAVKVSLTVFLTVDCECNYQGWGVG